ncbi:MAG: hypothetical protein IKF90_10160 [Parasporobacterium sp.]|nr:hypothetical protein [Parasporobacterium sp.]
MIVGDKTKCLRWLIDAPDKEYKITEYHPKRSLTANAYYWSLLGQLAEVLRTSNDELHGELLRRYSVPFPNGDGVVTVTLRSDVPVTALPGHWMEYKSNGEFTAYIRLKGSSDMDSKEFSRLVDGLVSECKEVGIETLPPHEIERLRGYILA